LEADDAYIVERIIDKDCKIGLGTTFMNKVFKGLIEETPYMGAVSFDEKKARKLFDKGAKCISQVKMDGRYCNAVIRGGEVELESRQGEPTIVTGAKFAEELTQLDDCVLNGELTMDGIPRYESNGIIASIIDICSKVDIYTDKEKEKKLAAFEEKHGNFDEALGKIRYTVWDRITIDEYFETKSKVPYSKRAIELNKSLKSIETSHVSIVEGTVVSSYEENKETILSFAIHYFRNNLASSAKEMIVPFDFEDKLPGVKYTIPMQGDKEQLLALSQKNADYALKDWEYKQKLVQVNPIKEDGVLQALKDQLHLGELPVHIECFDNSNIQGAFPVSAMVCFKNGQPSKSDYRKFNIKTVVGINDFASMKESVYRRYKSVLEKKQALPQLVIIDGGKGQLNAAVEALTELGIQQDLTTVGLAKNLEEIFFVGDKDSMKLNWQSDAHRLIRNIRDEVHRFGIQFHRSKRSKGALENSLDQIEGIGPKTKDLLLIYFKSVQKIKEAKLELLAEIIGPSKAKILKAAFEKTEDSNN
jgi:hypothetical protein